MLRIRELRLENNLTQKELAEKISSTSKNIWAYENQISIPKNRRIYYDRKRDPRSLLHRSSA